MAAASFWPPNEQLFGVHPSVAMTQAVIAHMKDKTGRSLEEWVELVRGEGPPDEAARRAWLKQTHGLGTNYAWWIAERADGKGAEHADPRVYLASAVSYVAAMFEGPKAGLRPLYEALMALAHSLGPDVKACPCQTIVPLYREHVFAQIKPTTRTRIDFGLALGDTKPRGRLIDTGGFARKDRITHRFGIASLDDIDAEVERWLRSAYERDAPKAASARGAADKPAKIKAGKRAATARPAAGSPKQRAQSPVGARHTSKAKRPRAAATGKARATRRAPK